LPAALLRRSNARYGRPARRCRRLARRGVSP